MLLGRPPIVAVLGHVDHGKTTLLDTIRKTNIASREPGGITQAIGAYQILIQNSKFKIQNEKQKKPTLDTGNQAIKVDQDNGRLITFIDTPGHEAFAKMRSRGASVSDIAILVVATDDSVKPQTKESIEQIHAAGIPMIVAANKIDVPTANVDRVKQDLAKVGVLVEGLGGDVPVVPISAKTGKGIPELLEMISLVAALKGLPSDLDKPFSGIVIETRVDKGKGMIATVIVKTGTLGVGTPLFNGMDMAGNVRAMVDEHGSQVTKAPPSKPVEVLGFGTLPAVGSLLRSSPQAAEPQPQRRGPRGAGHDGLPDFLKPLSKEREELRLVVKADTAGSLEAVTTSLGNQIKIVGSGIGDVTQADVLLAKSTRAIIVGFRVAIKPDVEKFAQSEKVTYRTYAIIYELLEQIEEVVAGFSDVLVAERELGRGIIIAEFPYEKHRVAGTKVASGRLARGDMVKIMRGEQEIARTRIKSMRYGKDDITKAEQGMECGLLFDKQVDFVLQDGIIAVVVG